MMGIIKGNFVDATGNCLLNVYRLRLSLTVVRPHIQNRLCEPQTKYGTL